MTKETLKLALEALEPLVRRAAPWGEMDWLNGCKAITAIKEALAQPDPYKQGYADAMNWKVQNHLEHLPAAQLEQEPVAWMSEEDDCLFFDKDKPHPMAYDFWTPLYTTPPQRKPLTDEEKDAARWRFLVDNSFDKEGVTQFHVWEHSWEPHSQTGEPTEWKQRVRGPALDRFIDRAIEAAHGIKE